MKIAIQGIAGSFHHQVVLNVFGKQVEVLEYRTFEEVARSVAQGESVVGVMAIENSIAGAILPNYELLDRYGLYILDEYYLPISHNLMALPGQEISDIGIVRSHPMAILQCRKFFEAYPQISLVDDVDTATVAKRIVDENLHGLGAIASLAAAEIYGLKVLAKDIQTVKNNYTRFILLVNAPQTPSVVPNKVSMKVTIKNEKGSLAQLLALLSTYDMDLTKIQSVPDLGKPWDYSFFIDAKFEDYSRYQRAIEAVKGQLGQVRIFGEYVNGNP